MKLWSCVSFDRVMLGVFAVAFLAILGVVGWCVWRFCRKKRPGKEAKEKEAAKEEDEGALVEHEEVKDEEARY